MKKHQHVIAISLGGSRASGSHDETSDYDVYVYIDQEISETERRSMIDPYVSYMEYSNTFWELEDDGILKDGVDIEFIYRDLKDFESTLESIVFNHQAWSGYTTCFWDNLIHSKILYDKTGELQAVVEKYTIAYPSKLQENIILKNCKLLKDHMPSFYYQLEKAVKRNDLVSVNHRLTELLASYFDVIFALNKVHHPGEKRLIEKTQGLSILPKDYKLILEKVLKTSGEDLLAFTNQMIDYLYDLVEEQGFEITRECYRKK
jgi:predicted nucleotidyltransferase